jgi:hemerythrin
MKWSDEYATGIQRIDEQHKLIFKMSDEYRSALDDGQGDRTYGVLLDFLERYIRTHFGFEERCMEEYGCPAARENRAAHADFTETLVGFRRRYAGSGYHAADARDLVDTLDRWFSRHIARVDVRLKEHVGK